MELENDEPTEQSRHRRTSSTALNAAAGAGTYAFIDTGDRRHRRDPGRAALPAGVGDAGRCATPILDSTVDPRFIDTLNRPAHRADVRGQRRRGRVHRRRQPPQVEGLRLQRRRRPRHRRRPGQLQRHPHRTPPRRWSTGWRPTRPGAATPTSSSSATSTPTRRRTRSRRSATPATSTLIDEFLGGDGYSYVFEGAVGLPRPRAGQRRAWPPRSPASTEWHINADEPIALDYNTEFKSPNQVESFYAPDAYRSSDHDPVLVGLSLNNYDFTGFFPPHRQPPDVERGQGGQRGAGQVQPGRRPGSGDPGRHPDVDPDQLHDGSDHRARPRRSTSPKRCPTGATSTPTR